MLVLGFVFVCVMYFLLLVVSLVARSSAVDYLESHVSEATCCVSRGMLGSAHPLS